MQEPPIHVVYLSYHFDSDAESLDQLLDRYGTTTGYCASLAKAGVRVSVVQRFSRSEQLRREGVTYIGLCDGLPGELSGGEELDKVHRQVGRLQPDLVHHNGLTAPLSGLRAALAPATPILWQHHGGRSGPDSALPLERKGFGFVDALLFVSRDQAKEWREAGWFSPRQPVFELMEGSTLFEPQPEAESKERLGLRGSPLFLWVGRLDDNKDPLTVLQGFAASGIHLRGARLYMVFSSDDLLVSVEDRIAALGLSGHVELVGQVPHKQLEDYYSGCRYFLLGSHREGSGYALLESLACGMTPIVTDIPSFRQITGGGRWGRLWRPGMADSCARALQNALETPLPRLAVRRFFLEEWSFDAIGRQGAAIYRQVLASSQ